MKPTHPGVLAAFVVISSALTWLLVANLYRGLPPLPWTIALPLLVLALGEWFTGRRTRARIQRKPGTEPPEPIAVARLLALAKASSYGGSVLAGGFAGLVLHTLPDLEHEVPAQDAIWGGVAGVSALVLVGCALYLEHSCRVPGEDT